MFYHAIVLILASIISLNAKAERPPKIVDVALLKSYVPIGFDDNDRVELTVEGSFSDTCHKVAYSRVEVDPEHHALRIWQFAYQYSGICTQLFVPFSETVRVGVIGAGVYDIFDGVSGKWLGQLPVVRSTHAGADDYLYAAVDDAFLIADAKGNKALTLCGEVTDRCTFLREVRVLYYRDVIVVQPIAERIEGRCAPTRARFTKTVPLAPELKGTYLLHVRSMNGNSINKLVSADYIE